VWFTLREQGNGGNGSGSIRIEQRWIYIPGNENWKHFRMKSWSHELKELGSNEKQEKGRKKTENAIRFIGWGERIMTNQRDPKGS
jgi:hypothetical protein